MTQDGQGCEGCAHEKDGKGFEGYAHENAGNAGNDF
jgi:hypothetical protein